MFTKSIPKFITVLAFFTILGTYGQKVLNMKDFNIEGVKDVTPIVVEALEKCKKEGISTLLFPKGTYHFYPTFAPEFFCEIVNNDNGLKRTAFPLIDFHDFVVDGNGADFIFHSKMIPRLVAHGLEGFRPQPFNRFLLFRNQRIKLRNLFRIVPLLVFAEQEEIGLIRRTPSVEE